MIQIAYMSRASKIMSADDLLNMATEYGTNNLNHHITGMLLYKKGIFFQVIEGPDHSVKVLYKKIKVNFNHYEIKSLLEKELTNRSFDEWFISSLELDHLNGTRPEKIQYSFPFDVPDSKLEEVIKASSALELIKAFKHFA